MPKKKKDNAVSLALVLILLIFQKPSPYQMLLDDQSQIDFFL
jgi:hypothetical protein